jgi:hypothetical protein
MRSGGQVSQWLVKMKPQRVQRTYRTISPQGGKGGVTRSSQEREKSNAAKATAALPQHLHGTAVVGNRRLLSADRIASPGWQ